MRAGKKVVFDRLFFAEDTVMRSNTVSQQTICSVVAQQPTTAFETTCCSKLGFHPPRVELTRFLFLFFFVFAYVAD